MGGNLGLRAVPGAPSEQSPDKAPPAPGAHDPQCQCSSRPLPPSQVHQAWTPQYLTLQVQAVLQTDPEVVLAMGRSRVYLDTRLPQAIPGTLPVQCLPWQ